MGAVVHPAQDACLGVHWPASNLGVWWFMLCVDLTGLRGAWGAGCICEAVPRRAQQVNKWVSGHRALPEGVSRTRRRNQLAV